MEVEGLSVPGEMQHFIAHVEVPSQTQVSYLKENLTLYSVILCLFIPFKKEM